ncbi:hypothetical protein HO151_06130, partial [Streptomyces sp. 8P21H-1]|nr:hypothetical protein [Streptomyces sp. 8P21H-1]
AARARAVLSAYAGAGAGADDGAEGVVAARVAEAERLMRVAESESDVRG